MHRMDGMDRGQEGRICAPALLADVHTQVRRCR